MAKPWENDPIVKPAQGRIFTLPQSPKQIADEARQAAADARQAERDARADADRDADNRRADRALALQESRASKPSAAVDAKGNARRPKLDALVEQIRRVEELYKSNVAPETLGPLSSLGDYLPTEGNRQFDTAAAGLAEQGMAAFRVPGVGAQSDAELRQFVQANKPAASDYDVSIEEKLRQLKVRVDADRKALGMEPVNWGAAPDDQPDPGDPPMPEDKSPPGLANGDQNNPATPWDGPNADMQTAASGDYRFVDNPRTRSTVAALINAGAGYATVAAAAAKAGGKPLSLQEFNAVQKWMKANPGKEYPASAVEAGQYVPLNLGQKIAGSPAGAFTAQMANAATAGSVGALAGERGKGALDAMATVNPNASLAGSLVGGITGALGAEMGVGARLAGSAAERFAPRIADSLYGAASGFNGAEDGEGVAGALTGAVTAPIAGAVGERAMQAVGSGLRGVVNPAVQRLRDAGIPLTVGQAAGQSGRLGNLMNKTEQAMSSIPGVGSMVAGRFDDGARGFNRAAFEIGAETTGNQVQDVGSSGLAQLRQLVGQTYDDALHPGVRLDVTDPAVAQDLMNAQMVAGSIPQVGDNAVNAIDYRVTGGTGLDGTMDGRDFQEAYRGLGRDGRAAARGDTYAHEVQGAMGQAQDALAQGLEAQNPGAYQGFVNANTANRRASVLADAINAGKNQQDELFSPAQLNTADANSATRLTGRMNSASGNRPFHQLAQDGQQIMGNRLPNSGTADRAMTGAILGTLGVGAGTGAGAGYIGGDTGTGAAGGATLAALLAAGGTRAGQRALTGAILNRPAIARAVGEAIQRNAQLGGGFGAGILTPLLVGSQ